MAQDTILEPAAASSSSRIAKIDGSSPGVLDPTQVKRVLRLSNSTLLFASFDPLTASTQDVPDLRKLSLKEELYRPKRVVVETTPTGESSWRFVPSARRDEDAPDEGQWPRVIEICGQLVECSQDQWDIYKLDPLYECYVKAYPHLTVISSLSRERAPSPPMFSKRRAASHHEASPSPKSRKTLYRGSEDDFSENEEEESEVEGMVVDDMPSRPRSLSIGLKDRARRFREIERNRKDRRDKAARRTERLAKQEDQMKFNFSADVTDSSKAISPESIGKRKVNSLFDSLRTNGNLDGTSPGDEDHSRTTMNYARTKHAKRTRTLSPASAKRDLEIKRLERERQKKERREKELNARRQARDAIFLGELYTQVPNLEANNVHFNQETHSVSVEAEIDEDAIRKTVIEESRRKLAELEADRPLWEAEARKRMAQEKMDEKIQKAKTEARHAALREEAERKQKEKAEQEAAKHEAAMRKESDAIAQREREKRQRYQRWAYGPWTERRALERYKTLAETFDTTKFSSNEPLTADSVPWPVLQSPASFRVEDVSWAAVEKFFEATKAHMRPQDFRTFVEKSHRRFHPDRWKSRSLLKSVIDETERGCMEVAANTVAQALTPLWQELTGRG